MNSSIHNSPTPPKRKRMETQLRLHNLLFWGMALTLTAGWFLTQAPVYAEDVSYHMAQRVVQNWIPGFLGCLLLLPVCRSVLSGWRRRAIFALLCIGAAAGAAGWLLHWITAYGAVPDVVMLLGLLGSIGAMGLILCWLKDTGAPGLTGWRIACIVYGLVLLFAVFSRCIFPAFGYELLQQRLGNGLYDFVIWLSHLCLDNRIHCLLGALMLPFLLSHQLKLCLLGQSNQ